MHATPRYSRVASYICLALFLAGCGDSPAGPNAAPSVRAVVGAGVTDTVDAQLVQALIVEVRASGGALVRGVLVRFEAQAPATNPSPFFQPAAYVCALDAATCGGQFGGGGELFADTTDAQGRVLATVRLGHVAGRAVVKLVVPEFGLEDSAIFTVTPGRAVRFSALATDTTLDIGQTITLRGRLYDRYDNPLSDATTLSAGPGSAVTVDAAAGTVTARDMGTQWVYTRAGSLVDSTRVSVVPAGRILVWSSLERVVRIVNLNGSDERTIVSNVSSNMGTFPHFDPTRHSVTLHAGDAAFGEATGTVIVVDTTGSPRRDISAPNGMDMVLATRQLADGTVLVVGRSSTDASHPGFSVWRIASNNTTTFVVALPDLEMTYGGADISHNGAKVVYSATPTSGPELRVLDVASGATTLLEANSSTSSPRWSAQDDRVAFLSGPPASGGPVTILNADGSGRRGLGNFLFSPGISWSPDGTYIIGRVSDNYSGLRVVRLSDGANITLSFSAETGCCRDYWQPDWR